MLAGKQIFDKQDSAKLKNEKALKAAGEYLAGNEFGVAVIEVSTGPSGSSEDSLTLAQGRALVVRDYIVQHFGFDDTKLKIVALGKKASTDAPEKSKEDWGQVRILIYPADTPMPAARASAASTKSTSPANQK